MTVAPWARRPPAHLQAELLPLWPRPHRRRRADGPPLLLQAARRPAVPPGPARPPPPRARRVQSSPGPADRARIELRGSAGVGLSRSGAQQEWGCVFRVRCVHTVTLRAHSAFDLCPPCVRATSTAPRNPSVLRPAGFCAATGGLACGAGDAARVAGGVGARGDGRRAAGGQAVPHRPREHERKLHQRHAVR